MRVLVTGAAGFIGSHVVRRLREEGDSVLPVDDLSSGHAANLEGVVGEDLRRRDLVSESLADLLEGVDAVCHLAAVPSVPRSVHDPLRSHHAAATMTLRLLEAARGAGVRRFVTSSSSSVYGDVARPPMHETMPTLPKSPYAVAKLAAEGYTRVYARLHGMDTVSLRYFNVFGPRQDPNSPYAAVIPLFVRAYMEGRAPRLFGDGRQSRDFTYVENVVDANLAALRAARLGGESVNIAAGQPRSVLDVLNVIADSFGTRIEPKVEPERPGDIRDSHADITLAGQLLGFRPRVSFEVGMQRTIEWLRGESR